MKILITTFAILCMFFLKAEVCLAQQNNDDLKKNVAGSEKIQPEQISYYKQILNIDTVKALDIARIQGYYKTAINKLIAEQNISDLERANKAEALMIEKNRQLKLLLSIEQQEKIIPTTERVSTAKAPVEQVKIVKP